MKDLNLLLGTAIAIVADAFESDLDKGGKPYVLHCLAVMDGVRTLGVVHQIVAVMHDLPEDKKEWTFKRLYKEGFTADIINALDCLTHRKGEEYDEYIIRAGSNPISREVKMSDLRHNTDITRLKGVGPKDLLRMEKYHKAYLYLESL